jgi:hypothetical protein
LLKTMGSPHSSNTRFTTSGLGKITLPNIHTQSQENQ